MADVTFIQRSRIGRSIFFLRGETLDISGSFFATKSAQQVSLRSLSGDYEIVAQRFWILIIAPLILAAIVAAAGYFAASQEVYPKEGLLINLCIPFVMFAWAAFRGVPRVELFVFFNQWKKPVFYIARERAQAAVCEGFIHELLARVDQLQRGLPADERPAAVATVSSVRLPQTDESMSIPDKQNRWKLCLVAGALTAAMPHLARATASESSELLALTMVCLACAALGSGITSFVTRERHRLLSLAGMALAFLTLLLS